LEETLRKFAFLLVVLLLPPKVVWAQTGAVVSYQLDVFDISVDPAGTGRPRWTGTIPKEAVSCNQPPLQPPTKLVTQNPSVVYWNDAANVGRICKASTVLLGTLPPMVPGGLRADGESDE
jgi:hypothetical protein